MATPNSTSFNTFLTEVNRKMHKNKKRCRREREKNVFRRKNAPNLFKLYFNCFVFAAFSESSSILSDIENN